MTRVAAWELAAKQHESEAILMRVLGERDAADAHLRAAIALAQEARWERAMTTSRAATTGEIQHTSHLSFDPTCPWCHDSLDPA